MAVKSEISDADFSSFLTNLGVDTYNRSFEWMLNDPNFSGLLGWMYKNFDHNNALSLREEYRYKELEKDSLLLSPEDLEAQLTSIQKEYPEISLPGDKEGLENVKLDISMQEEQLVMLEEHGKVLNELLENNELLKEELNTELVKLNSAEHQYNKDKTDAAENCLSLAAELETINNDMVRRVADHLNVYRNCQFDKDQSSTNSRFVTLGPLETYRQSQVLFKSHFDLHTSKNFNHQAEKTNQDLRIAMVEAKNSGDRLLETLCNYVETKCELSCETAKLDLVVNYTTVHPSQIETLALETQSALEVLMQEEAILSQQVQAQITSVVASRTELEIHELTRATLAMREQALLTARHALSVCRRALTLDTVLYDALRYQLHTATEFAQFAAHLKRHLAGESDAVTSRIESMKEITAEHNLREESLQTSNALTLTLHKILGAKVTTDPSLLVKLYNELVRKCETLDRDVKAEFEKNEQALADFKQSLQPLRSYIWEGCTRQPNCWDRSVASLTYTLRQEMSKTEKGIADTGKLLTSVKKGDKTLRQLWQWFLTDPDKLLAVTKGITPML